MARIQEFTVRRPEGGLNFHAAKLIVNKPHEKAVCEALGLKTTTIHDSVAEAEKTRRLINLVAQRLQQGARVRDLLSPPKEVIDQTHNAPNRVQNRLAVSL